MSDDVNSVVRVGLEARMVSLLDLSLGYLLAVLVFVMMCLTFVDVVGRQIFDSPVPAGFEITELMVGYTIYLGFPLICARREHITIGLFEKFFTGIVRRIQGVVLNVLFGVLTLIWTRELWIHSGKLAQHKEILMFLKIERAPFIYVMCGFTLLAAAIFFILAWVRLREPADVTKDGG
jgi:TRAP-type C4-dicarboxylate transport system permease small subunit